MFKLQSRIARIILNSPEKEAMYLFQQLNWLPFSHRYKCHVAVLVFKSLNGLALIYTNYWLTLSSNERYQLRSITKTNWTIPKPKVNFLKKAFSYTTCKVWNEIPVTIRSTPSVIIYYLYVHTNSRLTLILLECTLNMYIHINLYIIYILKKYSVVVNEYHTIIACVCNEAISPVTLTLSMICINLLFTLIKEITTSRIAYNYTHIHIFTNCSCNCFCFRVNLYCTILYCHPLYLSCEVQLSCMFVSFTCPSPLCFLPFSSLVSL